MPWFWQWETLVDSRLVWGSHFPAFCPAHCTPRRSWTRTVQRGESSAISNISGWKKVLPRRCMAATLENDDPGERSAHSSLTPEQVELIQDLKAMGRKRQWRTALAAFHRAKANGMPGNDRVYSCIISVVAKSGRWSEAVMLLEKAREDGLTANEYCFSAAISACAKGRNWKLALSLLRQMRTEGLKADVITYGSAISAMAKGGQWQRALGLLDRMRSEGLTPNGKCYGATVDALAKGGECQKAVTLLGEMQTAGVKPDLWSFNAAVHACGQAGQWEMALALAKERMPQAGVHPDEFTFNSVLHAMANAGQWEKALSLLSEMPEKGIFPDVVSFNTAIGACGKMGEATRAVALLEVMKAAGVPPDLETYSAAARACSVAGRGVEALALLGQARSKGMRPCAREVTMALATCVHARVREGEEHDLGLDAWRQTASIVAAGAVRDGISTWEQALSLLGKTGPRVPGGAGGREVTENEVGGKGGILFPLKREGAGLGSGGKSREVVEEVGEVVGKVKNRGGANLAYQAANADTGVGEGTGVGLEAEPGTGDEIERGGNKEVLKRVSATAVNGSIRQCDNSTISSVIDDADDQLVTYSAPAPVASMPSSPETMSLLRCDSGDSGLASDPTSNLREEQQECDLPEEDLSVKGNLENDRVTGSGQGPTEPGEDVHSHVGVEVGTEGMNLSGTVGGVRKLSGDPGRNEPCTRLLYRRNS